MSPLGAIKTLTRRLVYLQERLRARSCGQATASHFIAECEALKVAIARMGGVLPDGAAPVRQNQRRAVERMQATCTCAKCPIHQPLKPEAAE